MRESRDLKGITPETWNCIDCGENTAPGFLTRIEMEQALAAAKQVGNQHIAKLRLDNRTEVYSVHDALWKAAGMEPWGGCLCIDCLEKRLGRELTPQDFELDHPYNHPDLPGTPLLLRRRKGLEQIRQRLDDLFAKRSAGQA
jgi:hypothetical protein